MASRKNVSSEESKKVEYNHNEDTLDRDIWDAMTDGMYGDYPDDGHDGDYDFRNGDGSNSDFKISKFYLL